MADLNELVPQMQVELNQLPKAMAVGFLNRAARDFCEEVRGWVMELPEFNTVPGNPVHVLSLPLDMEAVAIDRIEVSGREIRSATMQSLGDFMRTSRSSFRFSRTPSKVEPVKVWVVVKPARGAVDVDDDLITRFGEVIVSGAISTMAMLPRKPWTSPELAQYHYRQFKDGMTDARISYIRERTNGDVRVKPVTMF